MDCASLRDGISPCSDRRKKFLLFEYEQNNLKLSLKRIPTQSPFTLPNSYWLPHLNVDVEFSPSIRTKGQLFGLGNAYSWISAELIDLGGCSVFQILRSAILSDCHGSRLPVSQQPT